MLTSQTEPTVSCIFLFRTSALPHFKLMLNFHVINMQPCVMAGTSLRVNLSQISERKLQAFRQLLLVHLTTGALSSLQRYRAQRAGNKLLLNSSPERAEPDLASLYAARFLCWPGDRGPSSHTSGSRGASLAAARLRQDQPASGSLCKLHIRCPEIETQ